eukprot:IDg14161t1
MASAIGHDGWLPPSVLSSSSPASYSDFSTVKYLFYRENSLPVSYMLD